MSEKPLHSDLRDGRLESRDGCALLDGRPVGSCVAFDTRQGWVEVFLLVAGDNAKKTTLRSKQTVRVFGHMEAIPTAEFHRLSKTQPLFEVMASPSVIALDAEDDRGEYRASVWVSDEAMRRLLPEVFEQQARR